MVVVEGELNSERTLEALAAWKVLFQALGIEYKRWDRNCPSHRELTCFLVREKETFLETTKCYAFSVMFDV